jgi:hypothetical protein
MRRRRIIWVSAAGICAVAACTYMLLQQEADRRIKSRNNLKQLLLAMRGYHEFNFMFPRGTHPNKELKPEKRLSWQADLMPYLEGVTIYELLDLNKSWDDQANRNALAAEWPVFINPGVGEAKREGYALTHYVGWGGLGGDGPLLSANDPRAGCFAYDRGTRITDIKDGLSNTAMVSESSNDYGSWAAGGPPTIRSLTKKPYVNGPDGIGGPYRSGCFVGFADMSVRFISKQIDPSVMEAMMTICGGEAIDIHADE